MGEKEVPFAEAIDGAKRVALRGSVFGLRHPALSVSAAKRF
ncbi:MAG TPA: hypothetical protein VF228_17565 [Iamia sp.]